jgi:hypothetical protein
MAGPFRFLDNQKWRGEAFRHRPVGETPMTLSVMTFNPQCKGGMVAFYEGVNYDNDARSRLIANRIMGCQEVFDQTADATTKSTAMKRASASCQSMAPFCDP